MRHAAIFDLKDDAAVVAAIAHALSQDVPGLPTNPTARERQLIEHLLLWRRMAAILMRIGWSGSTPPAMLGSW
jgi:hypothetical protein